MYVYMYIYIYIYTYIHTYTYIYIYILFTCFQVAQRSMEHGIVLYPSA